MATDRLAFPGTRQGAAGWLASNEVGLVLLIALFVAFFASMNPAFLSPFNLYAFSRVLAIDMIIGFSMMVVIVTGGLNLAVGAIGVSAVMFAGWLMEGLGLPALPGVLGGLALGAALGALNGLLVVRMRVHSFVVTLATMSVFFGLMILLTRAEAFRNLPPELLALGKVRYFGFVSGMILVAVAVGALLAVLFRLTSTGREILATGANTRAAQLSGVRVEHAILWAHALSGLLAAVAAVLLTLRNGAAIPSMAGQLGANWLLPAFLGPVLGGTLLTGGVVSVVGTMLGTTLVTVLGNGLLLLQVGEFWVQACLGVILLMAVMLDRLRGVVTERRRRTAA